MPRYAAFLRGVSPMNCPMAGLRRALESAGFGNVKTVATSGNAAFDARKQAIAALEKKLERAMEGHVLEHAEIVGTYEKAG